MDDITVKVSRGIGSLSAKPTNTKTWRFEHDHRDLAELLAVGTAVVVEDA